MDGHKYRTLHQSGQLHPILVITPENIQTYIPTLFRFPAFKKSQYEQSENDGHVIISEKEKHKININQM